MQHVEGSGELEPPIAFADEDGSTIVNFGVLTGREATQAEIDRLAQSLHRAGNVQRIAISAVRRQEYGHGVETIAHQVHVAVNGTLADVAAICREWALDCAADRRVEPLGVT